MTARLPLLLFLLAITSAPAQESPPAAKPGTTARTMRVLPLGEPPPFRQEVKNGVRQEQEPDARNIPPREVLLGKGETAVTIRLNLGRATEAVKVPVGTAPVILNVKPAPADAKAAPKPWLTIPPLETGDLLALTWRDPGKTWAQARVLVLPDSAAAFPAGNVRIVNLLPVEAALVLGADQVIVPAGTTLMRAIPVAVDSAIRIAFKNATGQFEQFYDASIQLNPTDRAQVVVHRADGEKPRQPAKAIIFNEATPAAPAPRP
jgi:hypothetical protein